MNSIETKLIKQLSPAAKAVWGKKDNSGQDELWLPLVQHLLDTKNVITYLYSHWLSAGQRALLCSNLPEQQVVQLVSFLGFIHDIGKATPAFQKKQSYIHDADLDQDLLEKIARGGLEDLNKLVLSNSEKTPHALAGEAILEVNGLNETVGAIIGGHHGKPLYKEFYGQASENTYDHNYFGKNHQNKWQKLQQELIDLGLKLTGFSSLTELPEISQPQAVILEGLVIMADWLASSQCLNDAPSKPMFYLIPLNEGLDDIDSKSRFQDAILTWSVDQSWDAQPVTGIKGQYERRWHFDPRPVQEKMSEQIAEIDEPGMVIIEAPMGIGKTEIALTAAEQLASATGRNGLFMGLPTQATTNAMFTRVEQWLKRMATDEQANLSIKLMHGKAQFNSEYRQLPRAENVDEDVDQQGAVTVNSWFSGKKSILNEFTIGTVDQLLLMALKQKHLSLRHLGFSGKVVVIDEVHAYDAYMNSYLERALTWLGAYRVPVVALSATLPAKKRKDLLAAYLKGRYGRQAKDFDLQYQEAYPLLTYNDGPTVKQLADFDKMPTQTVQVVRTALDDQDLVNKVTQEISQGGVAGVIVNTVKRAQQLASLLPKAIPKLVLHSAFLTPDRSKLEEKLQKLIGKNGQRPEKLVVIGTQVLEQSLDIDFDVLFTDIAPMDLILQRVGRLHRHKIKRPAELKQARVYVIFPQDEDSYGAANEAIYEKYILQKTDYFLPNKLDLPNDISPLVQKVYDEKTDDLIPTLSSALELYEQDQAKARKKARAFQIKRPQPKKSLRSWLDYSQPDQAQSEEAAQATVRDIKETIEVILLMEKDGQTRLIGGEPLERVTSQKIAQQTIRLPAALTPNINSAINKLEKTTHNRFADWEDDVWLRGSLALVLDENRQAEFNDWLVSYNSKTGLAYEKEGQDE